MADMHPAVVEDAPAALEAGTSSHMFSRANKTFPSQEDASAEHFFEWRDLSVEIGGKVIVQPQSGHVHASELFVILGPSGAGKTSLLSLLCGDRRPSTGSVHFQGRTLASAAGDMRASVRRDILKEIAYVRQRDIFMEALTVEETLNFTARLRMPRTLSRAAKLERVREVIRELGLESCAQTTIGSTMRRGVSGGELKVRKRPPWRSLTGVGWRADTRKPLSPLPPRRSA